MALSSTVLAAPALARDGAPYVGAEFGAMIVEDIDFDIGTNEGVLEVDHDYGYDGAIFAGYDLGMFRVEVELSQKAADVEAIQTTLGIRPFGQNNRNFDPAVGRTKIQSIMLNGLLDFGDDGWDGGVSGFIGGGIGLARTSLRAGAFANLPGIIDDRDSSSLAWQVVAGVRQSLTPNVDAHLKYRFFNTKADFEGTAFAGFIGETDTRIRTHSLLGGLTFNFGAPPVVVVPPPPPVYVPPAPTPTQTCPNGTVIPVTQTCPPVPVQAVGPFIVFFDWDRSDITPQAAAILDNAAAAYQQTGQAQVVLAGHADRSGSADYNVGLSQRRADAVRSYLAGRGVPSGAIATEAFGESRPLVETADGVREPQNRRVEITFGPGSGM
jgi:outer membrane protein OmpA-like peptidoglycan-associated protein/opacity protein-like surface antigen